MAIPDIEAKIASFMSNRRQELIIFPTEKCNFRCTYCYEDYTIGRMSDDTIGGVKAFLDRRTPELEELYLSWFGGEPLVSKDIVFDISAHASALTKKHPGLKYRGGMTTNAYFLTPSTLSQLAAVGILDYQITLDGPREIHNKSRLRADGKGTFDRIWENLLAIRDSKEPVSIKLRVHYDSETLTQLDPLIEDVRHEFLHDTRFSILFKSIERLGGPNDANIKIMSLKEKNVALKMLKHKLYGNDFIDHEETFSVCYASQPNSLIIRADGTIGKCTVALNDPRNHIGLLRSDGTLELNSKRLTPWIQGLATFDHATLSCPLSALGIE
ncbi:radical SAM protein [Brevibacillus laterosporus]|uniref:radical SAM protein n=1 Tax=Brevibacillus laterosporus TaxID=1465 RepID=UPI00264DC0E1|nr:radical SAM protein [Brevibacillus laterosporus]MDN9011552.1 radical SAM protein [Brevibacillus laterosporus]MDO0942815.1 radical SAM protein [Brevibacillus laterosporus]